MKTKIIMDRHMSNVVKKHSAKDALI